VDHAGTIDVATAVSCQPNHPSVKGKLIAKGSEKLTYLGVKMPPGVSIDAVSG
jgi:hypothetical protein